MLAYFCAKCQMYLRLEELLQDRKCPECGEKTKPRLVLGGQVMGSVPPVGGPDGKHLAL